MCVLVSTSDKQGSTVPRPLPSCPHRSCRAESNSSSWKATTKHSLEHEDHSSRCHRQPHQPPGLESP